MSIADLAGVPTTPGAIELYDDPGDRRTFRYNPETMEFHNAAKWVGHAIHGLHDPRLQYASGEGTLIEFDLHLWADGPGIPPGVNLDDEIRWFESLVFPMIDTNPLESQAPPKLRVYLGQGRGVFPCRMESTNVIHKLFYHDLRTRYAVITIKLLVDMVEARGYEFARYPRWNADV